MEQMYNHKRSSRFEKLSRASQYRLRAIMNNFTDSDSDDDLSRSDGSFGCENEIRDDVSIASNLNTRMVVDDAGENENDSTSGEDVNTESDHSESYQTDSDYSKSGDSYDESEYHSGSDDDDDMDQLEFELPLYLDAPLTVGESLFAIMLFTTRHKLSAACLSDLLRLIFSHCALPNRCVKTLYKFKKYLGKNAHSLIRHYYCTLCCKELATETVVCEECNDNAATYFIEIPLIAQLTKLFRRSGFYASLQHRFNREKKFVDNIEDIYDGEIYKSMTVDAGFLSRCLNLSFTWCTDGVSIFKSSRFSIWPFYFSINELPFASRHKKENLILGGLWFGSGKPEPNLFMHAFREPLKKLYQGVDLVIRDLGNAVKKVRAMLICGTCDLPAKALFLNMLQYNGKFGCQVCKIISMRVRNTPVYPFKDKLYLRTSAETTSFAERALNTGRVVKGVKGPTVLRQICNNYIESTAIDEMHCLYLGVVKKLLSLWFNSEYSNRDFSLHKFHKLINHRISSLTPPSFIQRIPRTITDIHFWKANEIKVFLHYYSIPILHDIMSEIYLDHYKLLVLSANLLNKESISHEMITIATAALREFVTKFESLYGLEHMTHNLHLLLHLPGNVQKFGPLWTMSCFPFEDANGFLKNLVHGTRYAQLQICAALGIFANLHELNSKLMKPQSQISEFCENLQGSSRRRRKVKKVSDNMFIVGNITTIHHLPNDLKDIFESCGIQLSSCKFNIFGRLLKNSILYDSEAYVRCKKTNSSTAKFRTNMENHIGIIKTFIRIHRCDCNSLCDACDQNSETYAIISKKSTMNIFSTTLPNITIGSIFLWNYAVESELIAINVTCLEGVCFLIKNNNDCFFVEPVNNLEFE